MRLPIRASACTSPDVSPTSVPGYNTARAVLAYQLTHSVLAIGTVVCAQFSWVLLLGPWAGTVVSRARSVQRLLITTQVASATVTAAMAALQFTGHLTEAGLIAGALGLGLAYCFTLSATSVLVPAFIPQRDSDLVTQREIRAALALDSASYNIGRCAAPLLAVLVVIRIGFGWAFALNAVSFVALAAALAMARPCSDLRPNSQAKVTDGLRVVSQNRRIRRLLAIVAAVTITADPVLVLGPALARHFGLPETWAGYFLSALGGGTILGSLVPVRPPSEGAACGLPTLPSGGRCRRVRARLQPVVVSARSRCGGSCLPAHGICCPRSAVGLRSARARTAAPGRNGDMGSRMGRQQTTGFAGRRRARHVRRRLDRRHAALEAVQHPDHRSAAGHPSAAPNPAAGSDAATSSL